MRLKNGEVCFGWPLAQHVITAGWKYNSGALHRAIDFRALEHRYLRRKMERCAWFTIGMGA